MLGHTVTLWDCSPDFKVSVYLNSAPRPDLALLASGKFVLSETQTLTCTEALMTQFIAQKLCQRRTVRKSQHTVGDRMNVNWMLGKYHVQNARRANEKLRACFSTCKVWVSPKFGVKGHYIHQTFKLSFLRAFMHTYVHIPATNLVQTHVHVYRWCLPSFGIGIFALSAADLVKSPSRCPELLQTSVSANISSAACSFSLMQLGQINMGD